MTMRSICLGLLILLGFTAPLLAQDQPPSAEDIVAQMQSKLNLTQDQLGAITPIVEKYSSKRQELKQGLEDGTLERNDMRAQMRQMHVDEKQELSQVLSDQQLGLWEKLQAKMRPHGGDIGAGGDNPRGKDNGRS